MQLIITLSSEIIIGGGQNFSKRKVNSLVWSHLTLAASVAGAWLGALLANRGKKSPIITVDLPTHLILFPIQSFSLKLPDSSVDGSYFYLFQSSTLLIHIITQKHK